MRTGRIAALIGAVALLQGQAHAALPANGAGTAPQCMDAREADALMLMFAAPLFRSLGQNCKAHISASSPLADPNSAFIAGFERAADTQFDAALGGIGKLSGVELPAGMDRKTITQLFTAFMPKDIIKNVGPGKGGTIGRLVGALAPCPPANVASIVTSIIILSQKDEKKSGKEPDFNICPIGPN